MDDSSSGRWEEGGSTWVDGFRHGGLSVERLVEDTVVGTILMGVGVRSRSLVEDEDKGQDGRPWRVEE